jgi:hypothetical protein
MNRSRANRKRLRIVRYETDCCAISGGIEHTRFGWAGTRATKPFYRPGFSLPYGWRPRIKRCDLDCWRNQ